MRLACNIEKEPIRGMCSGGRVGGDIGGTTHGPAPGVRPWQAETSFRGRRVQTRASYPESISGYVDRIGDISTPSCIRKGQQACITGCITPFNSRTGRPSFSSEGSSTQRKNQQNCQT